MPLDALSYNSDDAKGCILAAVDLAEAAAEAMDRERQLLLAVTMERDSLKVRLAEMEAQFVTSRQGEEQARETISEAMQQIKGLRGDVADLQAQVESLRAAVPDGGNKDER